jgi:O-antigen/teichoic acid export membrane protein
LWSTNQHLKNKTLHFRFVGHAVGPGSRAWPLVGQALVAALGLISTTIVARFLGPTEFGIYFLAATIVSIVAVAVDICVGPAIVTRAPGYDSLALVWRKIAVAISFGAAAIIGIAAFGWVDSSHLVLMWVLLAAGVPITTASMIPRAFLQLAHQLRFVAVVDVVALIAASLVMIIGVLVYPHPEVAALGQLVIATIRFSLLELKWRSERRWGDDFVASSGTALAALWQSVRGIYFSQLSGFVARNGDNLVVSLVLGPAILAQYSRAYSLLVGPFQQVQMALTPITIRDYAEASAAGRLERDLARSTRTLIALLVPICAGLGIAGESVVLIILGNDWTATARIMLPSAFLSLSLILATPARWALLASRKTGPLRVDALLQFCLLGGVILGALLWGLAGAVWLNAILVGPICAIVAWLLLPPPCRRVLWTAALPFTVMVGGITAIGAVLLGLLAPGPMTFVCLSLGWSLLVTTVLLTLAWRRAS